MAPFFMSAADGARGGHGCYGSFPTRPDLALTILDKLG